MDRHIAQPAQAGDSGITNAVHECWPGGPIVSNPKDCHEIDRKADAGSTASRFLPEIQIAGKTYRNNGSGGTDNEREAALERRLT
ncbi:MAG: hypothetical protein KC777_02375 [Cyanobacteria bacterium HKST-UBA02]|nr:hypothetical protein [Cyanobacteria bacterium HKST-UBA02]